MDIRNQLVIITGAASGMGAASAQLLAQQGAKLALLDIQPEKLSSIAAETGGIAYGLDVTDAAAAEKVMADITAKQGVPRALINCAGVATAGRILGKEGPLALDAFQRVVNINLLGSFNMMRLFAAACAAGDALADDERGVIINTASVAAYDGQIGQAAYSASKAALVGMTLPAARELARFGIRVMTIAPGLMNTPMLAGMSAEVQASLIAGTIFPKRLGTADEYAALALHIIQNRLLNGETIRLDGAVRLAAK